MKKFVLQDHEQVPSHIILSPKEVKKVLEMYNVESAQLPKIHITDPVVKETGAKVGDILKILRKSPTAGESAFYRLVID